MKYLALMLLLLGLTSLVSFQVDVIDSGKLLTFSDGKQIGSESFTITAEGAGEGSSLLTVNGQSLDLSTRTEYKGTHPFAFELEEGSTRAKLKVSINGTAVKSTGSAEATGETDAESVILENGVGYQYYFLVRRYDRKLGGVQQFKMFVPSVMQTVTLSLELKGPLSSPPGKPTGLEHFRAVIASSINVDLVTDAAGKLVLISLPAQKVKSVREEYLASLASIETAVAAASKSGDIDYSARPGAPFTSEEVSVNARDFKLAGTLLLPKSGKRPFPAVITITGSGQQSRDEPIPIPGLEKYGLMRQIAESLASRGIAVLRVDDRGAGKSEGFNSLLKATTSDFADDMRAQIAYLRSRPEIDPKRIALVGHSEGANIAPMIASLDPQLGPIVLMAGSSKRGDQITIDQLNESLKDDTTMTAEEKNKQRTEQQETIRAVLTGADLSKYPSQVRLPWIKEFWSYDPLPTIRKVRQPILILHGALDRQVSVDQGAALQKAAQAAGNKDVTLRAFPTLNHLFLPARTGAFSEYSTLETSVVPEDVLKALSDWLETRLKVRSRK